MYVHTCLQPAIRSPLVFVGVAYVNVYVYVYVYEHKNIYTTFMYTLAFNLLSDPQWYSYVYKNVCKCIWICLYVYICIYM